MAKTLINLSNNNKIEMLICSYFDWKEVTENWKICICYLLNLGYNINFISIGDSRLFCSSTQLFQDLMCYYPFTTSLSSTSTSIITTNHGTCLTSSNIQLLNSDLLLGFLINPILILLKLNIKFLSLIEIALTKAWKSHFIIQSGNTHSERTSNLNEPNSYFSMLVIITH
ncbi:Precorrin-2 C(20)-methyltransferase [Candidatus Hodgkinia cicadicola]|uniref:Precorrin-2 C(20)-methyltransferase n=1 Tax=Candidatus Hodgkinia cicadicola TaxID=573658 RepID=A0ABX4MFM5_9HYPH|nr:Precorrin-2 C(20)-methyltransferase [Candidatus Hodgkinia cicadicola]PIM95479.1 Precorrin-2 C(20)-methyltransferase [Candidatus Hodgkinia cicadicola]